MILAIIYNLMLILLIVNAFLLIFSMVVYASHVLLGVLSAQVLLFVPHVILLTISNYPIAPAPVKLTIL